ncbi:MAG: flavodoxin reductase [Bacteroidetes bacterium]|nr:flavodoxin reductase [Bacteroidota bacterium]
MEQHIVQILETRTVAANVKSFRLQKPEGYTFIPGQATEVSINTEQWKEEKRPFTFTSLHEDPFLEFTIKRYPDHKGVTDALHQLNPGDELIIRDVWGAIEYKGPGYFIAGGAGITPFLAILRRLHKDGQIADNQLFFSNKKAEDTILREELSEILGDRASFILTREEKKGYMKGPIDKTFLQQQVADFGRHFYICGPDPMVAALSSTLTMLGASADSVVFEK